MKDILLNNLDNAYSEFVSASAGVTKIKNNTGSYSKTVQVPYEHKLKVSAFGVKTNWVHDTETRYRPEVRFDQKRFDKDLANANKVLQEKQQKLLEAKRAVQGEIDSAKSTITTHDNLAQANNSSKKVVDANKAKLAHLHTYNTGNAVSAHIQKKASLSAKKSQLLQSTKDVSRQNQVSENQIKALKSNIEHNSTAAKAAITAADASKKAYTDKVSSLNDTQRAILAYKAASDGKGQLFSIIKSCGCWFELAAYIALDKANMVAFDRLLQEKIDLDSFVNEESTLALKVIESGNQKFIDKIFAQDQLLCNTAYVAFLKNDFDSLKVMLQHDADIISKIKDVEATGLSALQLAIGDGDVEKIKFIKEHAAASLNEEIDGFTSALSMALHYNNFDVIKEIANDMSEDDLKSELNSMVANNEGEMLERLIENINIQNDMHKLYKQAVIDDDSDIRNLLLDKIVDIKGLFENLIGMNNPEILMEIKHEHSDVITSKYLEELIGIYDNTSVSEMLRSMCDISDIQCIGNDEISENSVLVVGES